MRRLYHLLGVMVLSVLWSQTAWSASALDVAREFTLKTMRGDESALELWLGQDQEPLREMILAAKNPEDKLDPSDLVFALVEEKADTAVVNVRGQLQRTKAGKTAVGQVNGRIALARKDGLWKVKSAFFVPDRETLEKFWATQAEVCLRNLVSAQEMHYLDKAVYTRNLKDLESTGFSSCPDVDLVITKADKTGWQATARHKKGSKTLSYDSAKGRLQK
ncbi:MAG: hypothetical protein AB1641_02980 [Thermodesulfobacteriota bacterium]